VADDPEEKAEGDEPTAAEPARETAVGHQVVEAGDAEKSGDTTEVFFSRDEPAAAAEPDAQPQPAPAPPSAESGTSPAAADRHAAESHDQFEKKPEVFIGAAFVGAFVLGKLLKKLTRDD
jgi:hypothetical protein